MRIPDVLLDNVSVFDWFKPLDKSIDIVDKLVEDKDLRNELRAELQQAEIDIRRLAEQTYVAELQTKTTPKADAIHKLSRPFLSLLSLLLSFGLLMYYVKIGNELDLETMLTVLGMNGTPGLYTFIKGKGNPIK